MARTISPDYDNRRRAIIRAAATLYAKEGFLGASVNDLALACGMSKSLVYHYYPSKEDILFAVMSTHLNDLSEIMETTPRSGVAIKRLRELTRGFMERYAGAASSQKVLLNELDNLPADKRPAIVAQQRRIIAFVEDLLGEIMPRLGDGPALRRPAAMLFFGMINWTHTWYDPAGAMSPEKLADFAVELFVHGFRTIDPADYTTPPSGSDG